MPYVARGYSGTKGRPQLQKDILAMRDKAKRKKRLEANVAENQRRIKQGKKARTISEREIDKSLDRFRSTDEKVRRIQKRAADLRVKANQVERSKTGNKKAAATYRQAAKELLQRIPALRAKGK